MSRRRHIAVVAILVAVISTVLVAVFLNVSLFPTPASTQAGPIDRILRIMFAIGGVILALCLVVLVYSAIAFRHRPGDAEEGPPVEGNPPLELVWTLVPPAIPSQGWPISPKYATE